MKLLSDASDSIPLIFLITDGSVEDEREICNVMKGYLSSGGSVSPRICTFGIGEFLAVWKIFSSFSYCFGLNCLFQLIWFLMA